MSPYCSTHCRGSSSDSFRGADAAGVISAETHKMNVDYNAFEGWEYKG